MKNIVVFLAKGFEEIEAITVVDVLRRAGVNVDMCSLEGQTVTGAHKIEIKADVKLKDLDIDKYDGLVLPGGMPGSKYLKENDSVISFVKKFNEEGKMLAAICAAPIVLEEAKVLKNVQITCYPDSMETDITTPLDEEVVVSNNIITSRGPATTLSFSYNILKYLGLGDKAEDLKEGMQYNFLMK